MPWKPQKFYVSKPTVRKTDKREHNLGKRITGTYLVKIAHNSVIFVAKQVDIPANIFFYICKKAIEHAKENNLPITNPSNYQDNYWLGKPTVLSLDEKN